MKRPDPSGLLIVDKPEGPTSHDVVARIRRTLGTRSVGHAGTLDPMATGVLVVMVGACTKLAQFLALDDKTYQATVMFGQSTDTLDARGAVLATGPVPTLLLDQLGRVEEGDLGVVNEEPLAAALRREQSRTEQVPPSHSAIKQGGIASYRKARRGETVELAPRKVQVFHLSVTGASKHPPKLNVTIHTSKGYYVRAFARDLGESLEALAHLSALRRIRSGGWGLETSVPLDADAEAMREALVPVEEVGRRSLPICELTPDGALRAVQGKRLSDTDFRQLPGPGVTAWFSTDGRLVAVGARVRGRPTVQRAFLHPDELC